MATLCIIINNIMMCVLKASLPPSNVSMYLVDVFMEMDFLIIIYLLYVPMHINIALFLFNLIYLIIIYINNYLYNYNLF